MRIRELVARRDWDLRVLAGERHLDREIRWIHSTDLLDPSQYLRGGELILTNGLWRSGPGDAERFVTALATSGVHALGYAVFERGEVPDDLRAACTAAELPLLELPNIPFMEIAEQVLAQLLRERPTAAADDELAARLAAAATLDELVAVLAWRCGAPAWLCDRAGRIGADAGAAPSRAHVAAVWKAVMGAAAPRAVVELAGRRPATAIAVREPGAASGPPVAIVAVEGVADDAHEALERTAASAAMLLADRSERATDRAFAAETLRLLEDGGLSASQCAARLLVGGLESAPGVVVALGADDLDGELTADTLEAACRLGGHGAMVVAEEHGALAVTTAAGDAATMLGASALEFVHALSGRHGAVGLSRAVVATAPLSRRIAEARHALRHARRRPGPAIVHGEELGRNELLLAAVDDDLRAAFADSVLEPLVEYDRDGRSELQRTLQVFLGSGCSWVETARTLHLHVNTLRYRVARIEQLTGRSLAEIDARVDFYLALRASGHEV